MSENRTIVKRIELVSLQDIFTDPGLQMREELDPETIETFAEFYRDDVEMPPIIVFRDHEGKNWLADGFHRLGAAQKAGRTTIKAEVRYGTRRDALLYAVGANSDHGLRRSRADKRKALMTVLQDQEWGKFGNREIARLVNVTEGYVRKINAELAGGAYIRTRNRQVSGGSQADPGEEKQQQVPVIHRKVQPPPDAGDAWELPNDPGQEKEDMEVKKNASVTRDSTGSPVPRNLRDIFADTWYAVAMTTIKKMEQHVRNNALLYVRLQMNNAFYSLCESMTSTLQYHRPHSVCPGCSGQGCADCYTTGWLSEGQVLENKCYKEGIAVLP